MLTSSEKVAAITMSASRAPAVSSTSGWLAKPVSPCTSSVSVARRTSAGLLSTTVTSLFSPERWRAICQPTWPAPQMITFIWPMPDRCLWDDSHGRVPRGRQSTRARTRGYSSTCATRAPALFDVTTPSDFSLRCSAERSMPTKLAVRLILPPKRLICAIR
jgi:hypothetical protein